MGKTAAQRQREYRERKKANDPAFLERERARVHQYYRPAAQLGKRALAQRNRYALIRNQVSRMKKRERETGEAVINPVDPEIAGTALQIKIPSVVRSAKGKGVKKCRKRALAKANRHVSKLQEDIEKLSRRLKTRSKQVERLKAKMPGSTPTKKQAEKDLRGLNLSPSKRRCIKRKLLLAGALLNEMKLSKDSTSRKARRPLHSVVSGRITKKYRLISVISKGTGLSRNSLRKIKIKTSQITMEKRDCVSKQFEASVHEFMQREDNCRVQPGKGDATKVDGQKKQSVVLTDYLRNLHLKYLAENPATTLSLASFCRLRPKNIQLASFISRNACLCLKHQNMALKISAVRKCGGNLSQNPDHLVREETSMMML